MVVSVEDGRVWLKEGQDLRIGLTVNLVNSATVDSKVGRLVDECSGLGVSTDIGGVPEGTAEVDRSILIGIWSRDISVLNINITAKCIRTDVGEDGRISADTVVGEGRETAVANVAEVTFDGALARIGVAAEPESVPVRAARDTEKVKPGVGGINLGVSNGGVELRLLGR